MFDSVTEQPIEMMKSNELVKPLVEQANGNLQQALMP